MEIMSKQYKDYFLSVNPTVVISCRRRIAVLQFKRLLHRELNQLAVSSKSGSQVSEFIHKTFLGKSRFIQWTICVILLPVTSTKVKQQGRLFSAPFSLTCTNPELPNKIYPGHADALLYTFQALCRNIEIAVTWEPSWSVSKLLQI